MKKIDYLPVLIAFLILVTISSACSSQIDAEFSETSPTATPQLVERTDANNIVIGDLGRALDEYFVRDHPLFSGAILVAKDGEIVLSKGYNFANWELKVPNTPQTKFRISSISKPFTATLVMMLAEEGKIDLQADLCSYLADCPDQWQEIQVEDLLNHTSGVPDYTVLPGAREDSRDPHNVSALIDLFKNEPLIFTPGDSFFYSHSNYVLLGAVIEQVSNRTYADYLNQELIGPLQMEDSGVEMQAMILHDRASGYQIIGTVLVNAPYLDMSNAFATAGMYSTVKDLFRFDQALYSDQLLNKESLDRMYSPHNAKDGTGGDYGFGWQLSEYLGHRKVEHQGGINGFHTSFSRYIDDQATIILLSNIETEDTDSLVAGLEEILFDQN